MLPGTIYMYILITRSVKVDRNAANINHIIYFGNTLLSMLISTVQITFIFIYAKRIWFLENVFAPALGNTRLELL